MVKWMNRRILGRGSNAIVYLATIIAPQEWNQKLIAVKSSKPNSFGSLPKEKRIMESFIGCKEIVQFYFSHICKERNDIIYNLVMEFASYGSLGDLLRKKPGPVSENEVRIYTRMLLRGLSCIHQNGIVHCDLNPDNILLFSSSDDCARYQLKISDFGLCTTKEEVIDADFEIFKIKGNIFYMSPESVMGQIETSLDIWSLGCIIIEMFGGLRAWKNLTKEDVMLKLGILKQAPEIPNRLSVDCKDFLSKCFIREPNQRWTARMLLNHHFLF
ncbi:hypothetical protein VNO77_37545 [Canavalia gladiata]|uniref:Protein kinase domain-containing protein n=1 Tax=Canavalia gladiata TaxID=3824 RepID=A0AAN9KAD9_CANGL